MTFCFYELFDLLFPNFYANFDLLFSLTETKPNLELNLWDFDSTSDDCFLGLMLAVNPGVSGLGDNLEIYAM